MIPRKRLPLANRVALFLQVPSSHNCQICCAGIVVTQSRLLIDSNAGAFESKEQHRIMHKGSEKRLFVYPSCMFLFGSSHCKANRVRAFKQGFRELQLALTQIMYVEEAK